MYLTFQEYFEKLRDEPERWGKPMAAVLGALLVLKVRTCLPFLLAFAAGAMIYVVVEELIPEMSQGEHSDVGALTFALGFTLMMALDVALG